MIINEILLKKREDLEELKRRFPLHRLKLAVEHSQPRADTRSFRRALASHQGINLICELKKASPSEGLLRPDFQPLRIANIFEFAGAKAISVLTERHYFQGRPSYLKTLRQATRLPLLRKDFIIETYQLYESALLEADAYLLIASLLTTDHLKEMILLGKDLQMDPLVEVHTIEDLKKAIDAGADLIGINNRNLQTLEVDTARAQKLIPHVPKGILVVIESGFQRHSDLLAYKSLGVNNFLIGTALMKSSDIATSIRELLNSR